MGAYALSVAAGQADEPEVETPPPRRPDRRASDFIDDAAMETGSEDEVESPDELQNSSSDELPSPTDKPIGSSNGALHKRRGARSNKRK